MSEKTNYIEELKKDPYLLKKLPKEYLADKDIIKAALVKKWHDYNTNFEILELFKLADATLRYNKDFVKELIASCSGYLFEYLPLALREDEEILLFALKNSGYDYIYNKMIEDAMPDDEDYNEDYNEDYVDDISYSLFLHICFEKSVMCHAGKNLLNNKKVVLKTLELEENGFFFVSDALHDNKELALEAVSIDATNFESLSNRLRDDEDLALAAAQGNGELLAEYDYRGKWVHLESCFFELLSHRLKNDRNFIINLITNVYGGEFILMHLPMNFKSDKQIVFIAVQKNEEVLQYASDLLKDDKTFIVEIMEMINETIDKYPKRISKENYVRKPSKITVFKYVSERLKNDSDILEYINNS